MWLPSFTYSIFASSTQSRQSPHNLCELLETAAANFPTKGITIYSPNAPRGVGTFISYSELFRRAKHNAFLIRGIKNINPASIILLHFDNHLDNIEWYWAVVIAGFIPAISTPFPNDLDLRKKHILHLVDTLLSLICLTSERLEPEFAVQDVLNIFTIEHLRSIQNSSSELSDRGLSQAADDIASLILTSGSTGNAKAVTLRHGQILGALSGKSKLHNTSTNDVFFN
ncbi:hypothetical protein G7Y89_g1660 [Cudoniella acicularis]|uniref:AMP-dependent synthetase/ligase domain-containing protein n=1 Tax=Cudoniella acicularis TaxID=354080 RepID=A0A8H4RVM3_9HELO|nr:hypothetical protein G7Y89_g1660 [Cudoniella acicularis]